MRRWLTPHTPHHNTLFPLYRFQQHAGWGESGDGTKNGLTTNMHITSSLVDGPVPKELCIIPTLREHDFGGQLNRGHLTGALSSSSQHCCALLLLQETHRDAPWA
jgi:hypothetical protein